MGDSGRGDIFLRRSTDNGATWKAIVNVSNNFSHSQDPDIAAFGSNVFVVWSNWGGPGEYEIFFRRSTDGGVTWKPIVNLSNNPGDSALPQIAISGSNVYIVWHQENEEMTASDSFFRRSTDNGATWKSKVNLSNSGHGIGPGPDVAASGPNVYAAWNDNSPGDAGIYFQVSTDNGATWGTKKTIGTGESPQIGV